MERTDNFVERADLERSKLWNETTGYPKNTLPPITYSLTFSTNPPPPISKNQELCHQSYRRSSARYFEMGNTLSLQRNKKFLLTFKRPHASDFEQNTLINGMTLFSPDYSIAVFLQTSLEENKGKSLISTFVSALASCQFTPG